MPRLTAADLHAATKMVRAAGADEVTTATVVDYLIEANPTGYDSHGVIQIPVYVRAVQRGQIAPAAQPAVERETASMTLIDSRRALGQVSARLATDAVVAKAREHGVAITGTIRVNHTGRVGRYSSRENGASAPPSSGASKP